MKNAVYMMVTKDELELPMAIANSVSELAKMVGTTSNVILCQISRAKKTGRRCRFVKVTIDEDEE